MEKKIKKYNIFLLVFNHIFSLLTLKSINLLDIKITILNFILVLIIYTIFFYLSYLLSILFKFKLVKVTINIILPSYFFYSCIILLIISFIEGKIYSIFLNDYSIKNYYLSLLSCGYLPISILLNIIFKNNLNIFYLCGGIVADYFLRTSLNYNRQWERKKDKIYFITISMLMNLGTYWVLFPSIYSD